MARVNLGNLMFIYSFKGNIWKNKSMGIHVSKVYTLKFRNILVGLEPILVLLPDV